jgi:D-aminopeptidase
MDILIDYAEVNGKRYKLQHPGNREVLKLRARCTDTRTGSTDLEKMMDYCFEHVVIPDGHGFKPTVDNLHPREFENWIVLLPGFLRHGDLGKFGSAEKGAEKGGEEGNP